MNLSVEQIVAWHPKLYHMAQEQSTESILERGLLSTTALLDLFEVNGAERRAIESDIRPKSVVVTHPDYGTAVIRDNKPLRRDNLEGCLQDGITVSEWCQILNGRVFFWLSEKRLLRLLNARAYKVRITTMSDSVTSDAGHLRSVGASATLV